MLSAEDRARFDTLLRAFGAGHVALVEVRRRSDGAAVAAVCAVGHRGGDLLLTPFATMAEGDPFELFDPPAPGGGFLLGDEVGGAPARAEELSAIESDVCPSCGLAEVGTVESIPGVALGRIEGGRLTWSGETEVDWNGSETARSERGVTLECASCGRRWIHPMLVLDGP